MKQPPLLGVLCVVMGGVAIFAAPAQAQYVTPTTVVQPSYNYFCPQLTYNLYWGLGDYYTGGQVSQLQRFLSTRGYRQPVTGFFGSLTFANVARFQREQAVYPITGGVGPLTRAAIARTCGQGGGGTTAGFGVAPSLGQAPLTVSFSVASVAPDDTSRLYIDFGDGATGKPSQIYCFTTPCSPRMTASHTYTTAGMYSARLYRDNNYCPPGLFCTLQYREPTLMGTATVVVTGPTVSGVTASPQSGAAPLATTISVSSLVGGGYYAVDFGDGTSAPLLTGPVSHTYASRGTFTVQATSDAPCLHGDPRCMIATQFIGTATVVVY